MVEAVDGRRVILGDHHPDTLSSISNLGSLYLKQGKLEEAELLMVEAVEKGRAILGDQHPDTLLKISNLGGLYLKLVKLEEAEPLLVEVMGARQAMLGDCHPDTLISIAFVINLHKAQGNSDLAKRLELKFHSSNQPQKRIGKRRGFDFEGVIVISASFIILVCAWAYFAGLEPLWNMSFAEWVGSVFALLVALHMIWVERGN